MSQCFCRDALAPVPAALQREQLRRESRPYTAHSYIGDIFIDRLINHRGASIFHEDWGPKYEGGRAAHRPGKAESGVGFLERGQPAPLHQLGGLGSALSSPSGVWGGATAEIEFGAF